MMKYQYHVKFKHSHLVVMFLVDVSVLPMKLCLLETAVTAHKAFWDSGM